MLKSWEAPAKPMQILIVLFIFIHLLSKACELDVISNISTIYAPLFASRAKRQELARCASLAKEPACRAEGVGGEYVVFEKGIIRFAHDPRGRTCKARLNPDGFCLFSLTSS